LQAHVNLHRVLYFKFHSTALSSKVSKLVAIDVFNENINSCIVSIKQITHTVACVGVNKNKRLER